MHQRTKLRRIAISRLGRFAGGIVRAGGAVRPRSWGGGRRRFAWFLAVLLAGLSVAPLHRAEADAAAPRKGLVLIMVEEAGCAYCARWLAEVGPGYPLSDEGKAAPLHRIDRLAPEARRFERVIYTPTFILTEDGEERGRILGYPGADFFWSMLSELIARVSKPAGHTASGAR